jgi:hypothetical protein
MKSNDERANWMAIIKEVDMKKIAISVFVIIVLLQNILLSQSFTASHNKAIVDSLVQQLNPDAKLLVIKSDSVFNDGTAMSWFYHYVAYSNSIVSNYYLHTTFDSAVYDNMNGQLIDGPMIISEPWIDSDSALAIAERQGGIEFRNNHPNYKIRASLGQALIPSSVPEWHIYYVSLLNPADELFINVDANLSNIDSPAASDIAHQYTLSQNYPNPFNQGTIINYSIVSTSHVSLKVYDLGGNEVATLVNSRQPGGFYQVKFDGSELASGMYLYQLRIDNFKVTRKLILLK